MTESRRCPSRNRRTDLLIIKAFEGDEKYARAASRRQRALSPPPDPTPSPVRTKTAAGGRVVTVDYLRKTLEREGEAVADVLEKMFKRALTPLLDRLAALEARPQLKWAGIHTEGQEYADAQLVTRGGSLWVSTKATQTTPGAPDSDWRLIVKRGG